MNLNLWFIALKLSLLEISIPHAKPVKWLLKMYSRPMSVCIKSTKWKYLLHALEKKLFTYWMLPVYVELFRCNKRKAFS